MGTSRKLSRKFRAAQGDKDLELLLSSSSSYKICGIVEYDGFIKRSIDPEGISLIRELSLDEIVQNELIESIHNLSFVDYSFANQDIESSMEIGIESDIPNISSEIKGRFKNHKVAKYIYKGVQALELPSEIKSKVKQTILNLKEQDRKKYRKKYKNLFYFEHLYYAENVSIVLENTSELDAKTSIKSTNITPSISLSKDLKVEVTFPNSDKCPFAAKVSSIKDLID